MGMRATIAYVGFDETVAMTTVQWSTRIDQTLGHAANQVRAKGEDMGAYMGHLFGSITHNFGHISALEIDVDYKPSPFGKDYRFDRGVYAASYQDEMPDYNKFANREVVDIYDYHLDGGSIGAIYDERTPDKIEFFWMNDDTGMLETRKCGIEALANFYKDALMKPRKLKKFGFRR